MVKKDGKYILVIVESPGKIKKIESILGKGYKVISSYGHIIDLEKKTLSIDLDNDFEPTYDVIKGNGKFQSKTKVVAELRKLAKDASKVIIASDDDREGEMIGWSYKKVLNLKEDDYDRISFNSITKEEVLKALKNPSKIDMKMVESQKARRCLDRIAGYKISPELSKLIGGKLSAGRVQSIVLRLICDKENEIKKFFDGDNSSFFKYNASFNYEDIEMKCELFDSKSKSKNDDSDEENDDSENDENITKTKRTIVKMKTYKDALKLMENIIDSEFKISDITNRKSNRYPSPPYTTSTIQQDASTKLGFSVKRTMMALQHLYEAGYTTYLRTDSTNLSKDAMKQIKTYVNKKYPDIYNEKYYSNKKGNTQEAHEAIRPVKIDRTHISENGKIKNDEVKMYDLIWKRTVGSQMKHAIFNVYDILISISKEKNKFFKTSLEELFESGYLVIYGMKKENIDIPKKNKSVITNEIKCSEEYKKPPMRFTEAGLVKQMDPKNLNIGRPATYAQIISTIQDREYVNVGDIDGVKMRSRILLYNGDELKKKDTEIKLGKENKKFIPTELGIQVNNVMMKYFQDIMEYKFTSKMENNLDKIADGSKDRVKVLDKFWKELKPCIDIISKQKKEEIILGKNDKGYDVIATISRYGTIVKMQYGKLKKNTTQAQTDKEPNDITLEEALELLKYPLVLGKDKDDNEIILNNGRFGFYLQRKKESANIDSDKITLKKAIKVLDERKKEKDDKKKSFLFFEMEGDLEYTIRTGQYGNYIMIRDTKKKTKKPSFHSLKDDVDVKNITLEEIKKISKEPKKKFVRKKKTK